MRQINPRAQELVVTPDDIDILAKTIFGEARGEPLAGQIAIGWVVINRATIDLKGDGKPDWWGEGIRGVCLAPWQFSAWNPDDPNRALLDRITTRDPTFHYCYAVAALTVAAARGMPVDGAWLDRTNGATHYYRAGSPVPKWARDRKPVGAIGHHLFFNDVEK